MEIVKRWKKIEWANGKSFWVWGILGLRWFFLDGNLTLIIYFCISLSLCVCVFLCLMNVLRIFVFVCFFVVFVAFFLVDSFYFTFIIIYSILTFIH